MDHGLASRGGVGREVVSGVRGFGGAAVEVREAVEGRIGEMEGEDGRGWEGDVEDSAEEVAEWTGELQVG